MVIVQCRCYFRFRNCSCTYLMYVGLLDNPASEASSISSMSSLIYRTCRFSLRICFASHPYQLLLSKVCNRQLPNTLFYRRRLTFYYCRLASRRHCLYFLLPVFPG